MEMLVILGWFVWKRCRPCEAQAADSCRGKERKRRNASEPTTRCSGAECLENVTLTSFKNKADVAVGKWTKLDTPITVNQKE